MERTFSPFVRHFSALEGLQSAYTLVYSMDADEEGLCRLSLHRTGLRPCIKSQYVPAEPEYCYRLLQFLCENVVQPEHLCDVIAELCPQARL